MSQRHILRGLMLPALSIMLFPASAFAAFESGWAEVNSDGTIAASATSAPTGSVTVTNYGSGYYVVNFWGLSSGGGNALVTATGSDSSRCQVYYWYPYSSGGWHVSVYVQCTNASGTGIAASFNVSFVSHDGGTSPVSAHGAYVWMNQPIGGTLSTTYQWGAPASVTHYGTGLYEIAFWGLYNSGTGNGGNVQVTSYGYSGEYCSISRWYASGSNIYVDVNCFNASGNPLDTYFSLRFNYDTIDGRYGPSWGEGAFLWANSRTTSSYTPSTLYQYSYYPSSGGGFHYTNTAARDSTGVYHAIFTGMPGFPLVSGYGGDNAYCKPRSWTYSSGENVTIDCYAAGGSSHVDTYYSALLLGNGATY